MSSGHVLVVDDEADIRALIQEILTDESYEVTTASNAAEARAARDEIKPDLVLLDIWMPDTDGISLLREWAESGKLGCPVVVMSGHGTVDTAVEATRLGAVDFVEKPLSIAKLLRTVERALESSRKSATPPKTTLPSLIAPIGRSQLMKNLREYVQKLATLDSHVLFVGEPGSGRSAFASYLHSLSDRSGGPLVTLLSASVTDDNVEDLLFGSESGDEVQTGYLERAQNGTLIIDELSDLSVKAQKLVQSAIDQGSFTRKNGSKPIELKARIVATVDADYEVMIDAGDLRRDLIASLSTLIVQVPPLRDYAEDVPELLSYYVDRLVDSDGAKFRRFSVAAQNRLRNYPWPDNVRELKNLVQRLLLTGESEEITLEEIESEIRARSSADEPLVKQDLLSLPLREAREQFERAYLQQQLVLCGGKVGKLASRVGMERTHLYRKLRSLGVDFRSVGGDD